MKKAKMKNKENKGLNPYALFSKNYRATNPNASFKDVALAWKERKKINLNEVVTNEEKPKDAEKDTIEPSTENKEISEPFTIETNKEESIIKAPLNEPVIDSSLNKPEMELNNAFGGHSALSAALHEFLFNAATIWIKHKKGVDWTPNPLSKSYLIEKGTKLLDKYDKEGKVAEFLGVEGEYILALGGLLMDYGLNVSTKPDIAKDAEKGTIEGVNNG